MDETLLYLSLSWGTMFIAVSCGYHSKGSIWASIIATVLGLSCYMFFVSKLLEVIHA